MSIIDRANSNQRFNRENDILFHRVLPCNGNGIVIDVWNRSIHETYVEENFQNDPTIFRSIVLCKESGIYGR